MKVHVLLAAGVVAAFVAGPALAGDGLFGSGVKKAPAGSSSWPALPAAPKPVPAPKPAPSPSSGFKPYEPYKGSSVYAAPKPAAPGAKPCETSVYVNACGKRR